MESCESTPIYSRLQGCKPMNVPGARGCTVFRQDSPDRYPMMQEDKNTSPCVEMRHVAFPLRGKSGWFWSVGADKTEGNSERYLRGVATEGDRLRANAV